MQHRRQGGPACRCPARQRARVRVPAARCRAVGCGGRRPQSDPGQGRPAAGHRAHRLRRRRGGRWACGAARHGARRRPGCGRGVAHVGARPRAVRRRGRPPRGEAEGSRAPVCLDPHVRHHAGVGPAVLGIDVPRRRAALRRHVRELRRDPAVVRACATSATRRRRQPAARCVRERGCSRGHPPVRGAVRLQGHRCVRVNRGRDLDPADPPDAAFRPRCRHRRHRRAARGWS